MLVFILLVADSAILCYNSYDMKKENLIAYGLSILTLFLIFGFLAMDRYRNQALVKEVTAPENAYVFEQTLVKLDPLALTKAGVIQSYHLDKLTVRREGNAIRLALSVNQSSDQRLVVMLTENKEGSFDIAKLEPSKLLEQSLKARTYQQKLDQVSQQAASIIARDHWDQAVQPSYYDRLRTKLQEQKAPSLKQAMEDLDKESQEIGSPLYTAFFSQSHLSSRDKLTLVMDQMQATVDKYQFLQLGKDGYRFSKTLEPTGAFYSYFRQAVLETYQTEEGLNVDDLGLKLHLFRSWIDKQAIDYIRDNYQGQTDLDKLLAYSKAKGIPLDYTTNAAYHNRTLGDFTYTQHMKIQLPQTDISGAYGLNNARMIEYIVDLDSGNFISEWNVYRQKKDGSYDSNPNHYTIEEGGDIANTESANYGLSKGLNADVPAYLNKSHQNLDVDHPRDNAITRKMVKQWKKPKSAYRAGPYGDIVKQGGLKDLEAWRQVPVQERQQVYDSYIASGRYVSGFSSQEQTLEQTDNQTAFQTDGAKSKDLYQLLVQQGRYTVEDVYAQKIYGADTALSFDLTKQSLFGSGMAIRDGLIYGAGTGEMSLTTYFQGQANLFLDNLHQLPYQPENLKSEGDQQVIDLETVWKKKGKTSSHSHLVREYEAGNLLKLRITYNKDKLPIKIEGYYQGLSYTGWRDLYYLDYPDQDRFNQAEEAYIAEILYEEELASEEGA